MENSIPNNNLAIFIQDFVFDFIKHTGQVNWVTCSVNPSNKSKKRVLNLVMSFTIFKQAREHILVGDFSNVNFEGFTFNLEGSIQGTITIQSKVLDANKYIRYNYDQNNKKITLYLKNLNIGSGFLDIYLNDNASNCTNTPGNLYACTVPDPAGYPYILLNSCCNSVNINTDCSYTSYFIGENSVINWNIGTTSCDSSGCDTTSYCSNFVTTPSFGNIYVNLNNLSGVVTVQVNNFTDASFNVNGYFGVPNNPHNCYTLTAYPTGNVTEGATPYKFPVICPPALINSPGSPPCVSPSQTFLSFAASAQDYTN